MSLLKSKKLGFSALTLVVLALAAAQGCSSSGDDSQAAPTAGTSSGGASGHAGTGSTSAGTGGSSTAGTGTGGSSTAGTGAGGTAGSTTTMGEAGAGGAADCDGPDGCYNCAPTVDAQFLNHCVAGGCQPAQDFNLPATLPALP